MGPAILSWSIRWTAELVIGSGGCHPSSMGWRSRHAKRMSKESPASERWDVDQTLGMRAVPWSPECSNNAFDMQVGMERPAEVVPRFLREVLMENKVARTYLRRADFERWSLSDGCLWCWYLRRQQAYIEACQRRIEGLLKGDSSGSARLAAADERIHFQFHFRCFSLSLSLSHSFTLFHTLSHSFTLFHTLHTLSHSFHSLSTLFLSHSFFHTLSFTLFHSLFHSLFHTLSHSFTLFHTLSHSFTLFHTLHTLSHSFTLFHTLSHSFTLCHTLSHSFTLFHTLSNFSHSFQFFTLFTLFLTFLTFQKISHFSHFSNIFDIFHFFHTLFTLSHFHTPSLFHSLFHSLTLPLSHSLSSVRHVVWHTEALTQPPLHVSQPSVRFQTRRTSEDRVCPFLRSSSLIRACRVIVDNDFGLSFSGGCFPELIVAELVFSPNGEHEELDGFGSCGTVLLLHLVFLELCLWVCLRVCRRLMLQRTTNSTKWVTQWAIGMGGEVLLTIEPLGFCDERQKVSLQSTGILHEPTSDAPAPTDTQQYHTRTRTIAYR